MQTIIKRKDKRGKKGGTAFTVTNGEEKGGYLKNGYRSGKRGGRGGGEFASGPAAHKETARRGTLDKTKLRYKDQTAEGMW